MIKVKDLKFIKGYMFVSSAFLEIGDTKLKISKHSLEKNIYKINIKHLSLNKHYKNLTEDNINDIIKASFETKEIKEKKLFINEFHSLLINLDIKLIEDE